MPKKTKISEADINTFHEAVKDVKRLADEKVHLIPPKNRVIPPKPVFSDQNSTIFLIDDDRVENVRSDEIISFKQTGIPDKTLRKLLKGQYNVEAVLDLHGMTAEQARLALQQFIAQSIEMDIRVGLIIHGKGLRNDAPVLKNRLNQWLRRLPQVLAFCSAQPKHGRQGAMYVLLKRATR